MRCGNCAKEIKDTAKVCGFCGTRQVPAPAAAEVAREPEPVVDGAGGDPGGADAGIEEPSPRTDTPGRKDRAPEPSAPTTTPREPAAPRPAPASSPATADGPRRRRTGLIAAIVAVPLLAAIGVGAWILFSPDDTDDAVTTTTPPTAAPTTAAPTTQAPTTTGGAAATTAAPTTAVTNTFAGQWRWSDPGDPDAPGTLLVVSETASGYEMYSYDWEATFCDPVAPAWERWDVDIDGDRMTGTVQTGECLGGDALGAGFDHGWTLDGDVIVSDGGSRYERTSGQDPAGFYPDYVFVGSWTRLSDTGATYLWVIDRPGTALRGRFYADDAWWCDGRPVYALYDAWTEDETSLHVLGQTSACYGDAIGENTYESTLVFDPATGAIADVNDDAGEIYTRTYDIDPGSLFPGA
ncbi:MAG: hypothetical protein KQH83_09635 [Actinobacteria bacterium]|nr:hypothetical protein [Actinomycetota bacterium]